VDVNNLNRLTSLLELVDGLERDLGLSDLSDQEKRVFLALWSVAGQSGRAKVGDFMRDERLSDVSRTSFFRHLSKLCERGRVKRIDEIEGHPTYEVVM
jgi:hypothetical protein